MTHPIALTLEAVEAKAGRAQPLTLYAGPSRDVLAEAIEAFCDAYPLEAITPPWYVDENAGDDGWRGVAGSETQDALALQVRRFDLPRRVEDYLFGEWLGTL